MNVQTFFPFLVFSLPFSFSLSFSFSGSSAAAAAAVGVCGFDDVPDDDSTTDECLSKTCSTVEILTLPSLPRAST